MEVTITSVKREIIRRVKVVLGDKGKYLDTPDNLTPSECTPFAVAISSDSATKYKEICSGVFERKSPISLDIFCRFNTPKSDRVIDQVAKQVLTDGTLNGRVHDILILETSAKKFHGEKLKVLMFDFLVTFNQELRCLNA